METSGISNQYMSLDSSSLQELVKSKNASASQKNAVVSQQFESVMIKQFLNDALKPMFKGVFNEEGEGHRLYRHFFTDAISESIAKGGGFGISSILQEQLNSQLPASSETKEEI
jgi:Rod binding domain-containing protein